MSYIEVSNFSKSINNKFIIQDINLKLEQGEVLVILGKSGAGKTTLLRNINLLDLPNSGRLDIDGEIVYNSNEPVISNKELQKRHKLIGLVFQSFNLFPQYTVLDNVTLALKLNNKKKIAEYRRKIKNRKEVLDFSKKLEEEVFIKASKILNDLDLGDKLNSYPYQLSGGEQQRTAIARALILNPKVLCFDEPTSALDPSLTKEVISVINELKNKKQTMIIITHEIDFAMQVADKIIVMDQGKIIEEKVNYHE